MIIPRRPAVRGLCLAALIATTLACTPMSPGAGPSAAPSTSDPAPSSPAPSSPSASNPAPVDSPAGPAKCRTADLAVGITEAGGGAGAGSNYLLITFRNSGSKTCTLYGWPGVSLVGDGNGTQLGAAAVRVQAGARRTVTVKPGKQTTALLQVAEAGNYSDADCDPATADGFRIYPPDQTAATYVQRSTPACRKSGAKLLQIAPVGTSG